MILQTKLFHKFLLSKDSNFISHAISKLHSTYLKKQNHKSLNFRHLFNLFSFYTDKKNFIYRDKSITKTDILIISNIIFKDNFAKDIYFGNLDKLLDVNNIKNVKVLRNFTYKKSSEISHLLKKKQILLSKRVDYTKELKFLLLTLREYLIFIFLNKYKKIKNFIRLRDFVSIPANLRLIYQIDKVLEINKPKIIIFTYEGHAWERLLIKLCKKKYTNLVTIGYQFSTIKEDQIGIFRKLKDNYNPDFIATSGEFTKNQMMKKINFSELFKLGSTNFVKKKTKLIKSIDLLVALDSGENELIKMVKFCVNFSKHNKKFKILLRYHPIYRNNLKIVNYIFSEVNKVSNIEVSNNSLDVDLTKSKYLLFTDSAVGITCLKYNVTPLFFQNKFSKNIFSNKFPKKYIISNNINLKLILKNKSSNNLKKYFDNYQNKYFEKFNLYNLKKILENKK